MESIDTSSVVGYINQPLSAMGINDQPDRAHQGFKALRWLLEVCKPAYHFHGHVHVNSSTKIVETLHAQTAVVNTYGYRKTTIDVKVIISRGKKESNNGK